MKSLYVNIEDNTYQKVMAFLKSLPKNKIRIVEEISSSEELEEELLQRREEVRRGEVLSHDNFWEDAGV